VKLGRRLWLAAAALVIVGIAPSGWAQVGTTYGYDAQGRLISVARPGETIAYQYDAASNRVAVTPIYPPPVAASASMSVPFGGSASLALPVSGQVTNVAFDTAPSKGTLALSGTTVSYTASGSNYGADSFTYHAVGPGGNSAPQTVSVTIGNPPAPTVANTSLTSVYNGTGSVVLPISGVFTSIGFPGGSPAHGVVSLSGATVTYFAKSDYSGADSFTYNAAGPGGISGTATVGVTVSPALAPTVGAVSASTAYNTATSIALTPSGSYTSLAVASAPSHGSASISGATATYTPTGGYIGADSFTYKATGPGGVSGVATVSITVNAPPAPTVANTSLTSAYNSTGSVVLPVNGLYTSIGFPGSPAHGALSLSGATVTYAANSGYSGADSFTYNATGPGGSSGAATVSVTVSPPPNNSPVCPASKTLSLGYVGTQTISMTVSAAQIISTIPTACTDADGDTLTLVAVSGATLSGTAVTVSVPVGGTSFTYTVSDGRGGTTTGKLVITRA
jgi:YD repeat-containing protein